MAWVLRLDANGHIMWEQSFRGHQTARASAAAQLSDGSFAVAGNVHWLNSDENGIHIIRLGAGGNILSDQTFRDLENCAAQSISALPGGGFAAAGSTDWSPDLKYIRKGYAWVLRFGSKDKLLWEKKLGSVKGDGAMSIAPAADGGLIVAVGVQSQKAPAARMHGSSASIRTAKSYGTRLMAVKGMTVSNRSRRSRTAVSSLPA